MPAEQHAIDLQKAIDVNEVEGTYVIGPGQDYGEFVFEYYHSNGVQPATISVIVLGTLHRGT